MGTPTKKIIFIEDVEVKDHNGDVEFSAAIGEVKELSTASANRWLRRNKASTDIKGSATTKAKDDQPDEQEESKQDAPITAAEKSTAKKAAKKAAAK